MFVRRYYWFEVLDENCNVLLDTDGVGNALATILEDSKLQVTCFSILVFHVGKFQVKHSLILRCSLTKKLL